MIQSKTAQVLLTIDPHSGVPVYRQLVDQVRGQIIEGRLVPGDELPGTGSLSSQLGVNPTGVNKAYRHLERAGLLERRDGHALVARLGSPGAVGPGTLEDDLELAAQIQSLFLPQRDLRLSGWEASYIYDPLSHAGGDFCDLAPAGNGDFYFVLGDVTGKGLAAALLMAHLQATFRALLSQDMPIEDLVQRVNEAFCEITPPTHFATLVCGKAGRSGEITICNAGHNPPLLLHQGEITEIPATGLPVGIFSDTEFSARRSSLSGGDTLLLYTDGLTETANSFGCEYGTGRLSRLAAGNGRHCPDELLCACRADLDEFRSGAPRTDDLTIMAIQRKDGAHKTTRKRRARRDPPTA